MDDQLDDDLKNRIKDLFDNYEDPSADEGWLLLREKFPEKAKRRPVAWLWWSSAAAILLLFAGIFWLAKPIKNESIPLVNNHKPPVNTVSPKADENKSSDKSIDSLAFHQPNQSLTGNIKRTNPGRVPDQKSVSLPQVVATAGHPINYTYFAKKSPNHVPETNAPVKHKEQNLLATQTEIPGNQKAISENQGISGAPAIDRIKVDSSDQSSSAQKLAVVARPPETQQQPVKSGQQVFADNSTKKIEGPKDRRVRFGVYATTYLNYARGSSNQFNIGGGITSDIRLNKRFKLSTGIAVGQNTLNYNFNLPIAQQTTPSYLATNNLFSTKSISSAASNTPVAKKYNASLIGLDIPLNLKYIINPKKSDTYISAGFSSGTFINEKYNYSYNFTPVLAPGTSQTQDLSTRNRFNGFYFAKTLNFSFGTGYNFGGNRLIIEPFFKYPLEGLGSQQLRFGSSGVNLKFNFKSFK